MLLQIAHASRSDAQTTLEWLLCWLLQAELSSELALRGLPKSGLKAELAERLFEAIESEGEPTDVLEAPTVVQTETSG